MTDQAKPMTQDHTIYHAIENAYLWRDNTDESGMFARALLSEHARANALQDERDHLETDLREYFDRARAAEAERDEARRLLAEAQRDADRWRAFSSDNGQEYDLSSGPGSPKTLIIRLDVTGLDKYLESGAPDHRATLNAVADDEIERRACQRLAETDGK